VTRPPGYELRVDEEELDVARFESLAAAAREQLSAGNAKAAAKGLREALELWRGPALREFRSEPFAEIAAARLEDLRLGAVEDRLQAELDAGEAARVVPELEELVAAEPLRERPRELLMLALYRAGRQADALDLYRRTRDLFVNELGIEPGPALRELEQAVLRQDESLAAPTRRRPRPVGEALAEAPPRPSRGPLVLAFAVAAVLLVSAVAATLLLRGGGNSELQSFVLKMENFLAQSRPGRKQVRGTIQAALSCKLSPATTEARLDSVTRNRQSLLDQIAALHVPPGREALRASDLLQTAIAASIAVDGFYRDWFRAHPTCPRGSPPPSLRAADARATKLKQRFLAAFNPLARRFGQREWKVDEF
jgi:hypothetical protein